MPCSTPPLHAVPASPCRACLSLPCLPLLAAPASPCARETPVYAVEDLLAGHRVPGPALVVEPNSTVLLEPGCSAVVTSRGDLEVLIGEGVSRCAHEAELNRRSLMLKKRAWSPLAPGVISANHLFTHSWLQEIYDGLGCDPPLRVSAPIHDHSRANGPCIATYVVGAQSFRYKHCSHCIAATVGTWSQSCNPDQFHVPHLSMLRYIYIDEHQGQL